MTVTDPHPRRWGLGVGITALVLGVIVAIGAVGWGAYSLVLQVIRTTSPTIDPLMDGEPGSPHPATATECDDPCFGPDHLFEARLAAADFERLGTPVVVDPAGTYADSTASEQNTFGLEYWSENDYGPDSCLFTASEAPVVVSRAGDDGLGGSIHWLTSFESESGGSIAVRAVRFFPSAEAANAHMTTLDGAIGGCSGYAPESLYGSQPTTVTAMPRLGTPPTVAAIGWVETTERLGRYYVVDLVRSNAVMRLALWTPGEINEASFRDLAARAARDLAGWPLAVDPGSRADRPVPGFIPDETGASGPRADCEGDCFSVAQALTLVPSEAELSAVGLRRTGGAETAGDAAGEALRSRQAIETSNAQCRFALGIEPVVRGNPTAGSAAETDPLIDLGHYAGGDTSMTVVARVFENPERASAYAGATDYALNLCSSQVVETRRGSGEVTMLPATLVGYDSSNDPIVTGRPTEHIGWQHSGALTDRGHDLQHGNIVVRVVIDGDPLTEEQVASLILPMIARLEALEPVR